MRRTPIQALVITPEELEERIQYGGPFVIEILEKGEVLYDAERVQAAQRIGGLNELGRERVNAQRVAQKPGF
jgi:hypothetical protein